jgi:hypothetical protein
MTEKTEVITFLIMRLGTVPAIECSRWRIQAPT